MPRSRRRKYSTRSSCYRREKFNAWPEEKKADDASEASEKTSGPIDDGSFTSVSSKSIERVLSQNSETRDDGGRQCNTVIDGNFRRDEFDISNTDSDNLDWVDLFGAFGSASSSADVEYESTSGVLDGTSELLDIDFDVHDLVDSFEEVFEDVVQEYGRALYSKFVSGRHKYISTVVVPDRRSGVDDCIAELKLMVERYAPRHWYAFATHGDHVHISHICANINESCRCSWIKNCATIAKWRRPNLRRTTRAINLQPSDYASILRYLCSGTRFVEGVGGFNEDERLCSRYQYLSVCIKTLFIKTTNIIHQRTKHQNKFAFITCFEFKKKYSLSLIFRST